MDSALYQSVTKTLAALGGIVGVGAIVVIFLFFMDKKWFWLTGAGLCGLVAAALFVKSIVAFQFLAALIYAFLTWTCWSIAEIAVKHIPRETVADQNTSTNQTTNEDG